jgi:hypothetical protein
MVGQPISVLDFANSIQMDTLSCTTPSDAEYNQSMTIVEKICNDKNNAGLCRGIKEEPKVGEWGSYSMCTLAERAAWVANQLYMNKQGDPQTCKDAGGVISKPNVTEPQTEDCKIFLKQVGPDAVGSVSITPTPMDQTKRKDRKGLDSGAKSAIGASIGGFLILVLFSFLAFYTRARRRRKTEVREADTKETDKKGAVELSAKEKVFAEVDGTGRTFELHGFEVQELGQDPPELQSAEIFEMDAAPLAEFKRSMVIHNEGKDFDH